jgi:hypothetical protein
MDMAHYIDGSQVQALPGPSFACLINRVFLIIISWLFTLAALKDEPGVGENSLRALTPGRRRG